MEQSSPVPRHTFPNQNSFDLVGFGLIRPIPLSRTARIIPWRAPHIPVGPACLPAARGPAKWGAPLANRIAPGPSARPWLARNKYLEGQDPVLRSDEYTRRDAAPSGTALDSRSSPRHLMFPTAV